jgi:hypothetical protein
MLQKIALFRERNPSATRTRRAATANTLSFASAEPAYPELLP